MAAGKDASWGRLGRTAHSEYMQEGFADSPRCFVGAQLPTHPAALVTRTRRTPNPSGTIGNLNLHGLPRRLEVARASLVLW